MTELHISPDLALPIDAATETFGILAKKGAGKSNAAVVMAEEMWDAGVPWVAVDPKGDWWGVRSSGDGTKPGLALPVFGGRHGDVPLEPTAGALLADLVLTERLTCVLDVSEFSKGETTRFLLAFAQRLFRQAEADPLHLFLEEAHEYLPQMVRGDQAEMVGAWQRIVKQGRFKGLGCTLVSQRSAALNKDVLTQVDTLIVLRTMSPQDRAAVKGWVDVHADAAGMLDSLPSLADGEAWLWSPEFLGTMKRIRFRRRRTFDSGATPKVGQARKAPATLADVDLASIKEQMADTIEKAKADDPKELRKRIAQLERELRERPTEPVIETVTERVEVPVLDDDVRRQLGDGLATLNRALDELGGLGDRLRDGLALASVGAAHDHDRPHLPREGQSGDRPRPGRLEDGRPAQRPDPPARRQPRRETVPGTPTRAGDDSLGKAERAFLTVLAQFSGVRTRDQVAIFAGYSVKSRHIDNTLATLRAAGYITGGRDNIEITADGTAALGEWESLPTGPALIDHYKARFLGKAEITFLDVVLAAHPEPLTRDEIAERAGYSVQSRHVDNTLARLRSLQLVTGGRDAIRLTDVFAEAIA